MAQLQRRQAPPQQKTEFLTTQQKQQLLSGLVQYLQAAPRPKREILDFLATGPLTSVLTPAQRDEFYKIIYPVFNYFGLGFLYDQQNPGEAAQGQIAEAVKCIERILAKALPKSTEWRQAVINLQSGFSKVAAVLSKGTQISRETLMLDNPNVGWVRDTQQNRVVRESTQNIFTEKLEQYDHDCTPPIIPPIIPPENP